MTGSSADRRARIASLADQCVKCGLCLPVCPTYHVDRTEAESPRGRIAFAHALATFQLGATPLLTQHLDNCLVCMSCESVCPSGVRYGELIVSTRELLHEAAPARVPDFILRRPHWLRALVRVGAWPALRSLVRSRFTQMLLRPLGLDRFARELPDVPPAPHLAKAAPARGRVGLFLGCVAAVADRDVHAGARRLLAALGFEAVAPQGCCGALALHAGDVRAADALSAPTRAAFETAGVDTVLVSASGCFGTLRDRVFRNSAIRVREIHEFLAAEPGFDRLHFKPLPRRALLHTPCTQASVAKAGAAIGRLLARIPGLDVAALPQAPRCCGAAGDYFLRHAQIADALRAENLDRALAQHPDLLISSNVGCRIFLDNGLRQRGEPLRVTHPIALLAAQLEN